MTEPPAAKKPRLSPSPAAERTPPLPDTDPILEIINSIKNGTELLKFKRLLKRGGQSSQSHQLFKARLVMKEVPYEWSPLVVAVDSGRLDILKYVLRNYSVNIEQETAAVLSDNATALWVACARGDIDCVKVLVSEGANIEHRCGSPGVTPLLKTISCGHLNVAKYLVNNSANVNECHESGKTALSVALECCFREKGIFELLIEKGANLHCSLKDGNGLLHLTSWPEIAKILVDAGARNPVNDNGLSAVLYAALNKRTTVVSYLIDAFKCDPREKYDCYCIQAVIAMENPPDQDKAASYVRKAVELRLSNPDSFSDLPSANEIYDGIQEPATMTDYLTTAQSKTRMYFVCSIYCERILGKNYHETVAALRNCIDDAFQHCTYDKCIQFCHRCLNFGLSPQIYGLCFTNHLLYVVETIAKMVENGYIPRIQPLFECGLKALRKDYAPILLTGCVMRLVAVWIKVVDECIDDGTEDKELALIKNALQDMIKESGNDGSTIVRDSLCCVSDENEAFETLELPLERVLELLLDLGCPIQCEDEDGDFPLHLAAAHLHEPAAVDCVRTLLEYGAHIDAVNFAGQTIEDVFYGYCDDNLQDMLDEIEPFHRELATLQCLSARAIAEYKIEFRGCLPASLAEFVSWHCCHRSSE